MHAIRSYRVSIAYAVAVAGPFLITAIRQLTSLNYGERGALAFFGLPVVIAALMGGVLPGLLAVVVGAGVGTYFFWPSDGGNRFDSRGDIFVIASFIFNWGLIAILCDFAQRRSVAERRASVERAATEAQLAEVLHRVTDGFFTMDARRKVTMANREMLTLVGLPASSVVGKPVTEAFAGFLTPAMERQIETALTSGSPITNVAPEEVSGKHFQVRAFPSDTREAVAVFVADVTAQRELDEARVRMLAEERAKRSDAEQRSRSKDDFVAMLSHELRTPITSILGWTEILRPKVSPDDALMIEGLSSVERAAKVQAKLINDLLDMSRIVTGNLPLTMESVDLGELIDRVVREHRNIAASEKRTLAFERPLEMLAVRGDPLRLRQIVSNLVGNSLKFTEEGGTITIGLRREGTVATITVKDDGIGIEKDVLPIVFHRFMQGSRTQTRKHGGLGIGLAIVHQLVLAHHGEVYADSEGPGKGATMTVRLPLLEANPEKSQEEDIDSFFEVDLSGMRIVMIEDDELTRRVVAELLTSRGALVRDAATSTEALEMIEHEAPDLIVSDIGLPDIDGMTFIAMVRANRKSEIAKIPAIALTAFAGSDDRDRALLSGFDAHFPKPIDFAQLTTKISQLASKRSAK